MTEHDLRQPVANWLKFQGFEVAHECLLGGYCDLIGFRFAPRVGRRIPPLEYVVAVELKVRDIAGVIRQAKSNRHYANESYAAMPRERCIRMRQPTLERFLSAGIGLLRVDASGSVDLVVGAGVFDDGREQSRKSTWWRWHRKLQKRRPAQ